MFTLRVRHVTRVYKCASCGLSLAVLAAEATGRLHWSWGAVACVVLVPPMCLGTALALCLFDLFGLTGLLMGSDDEFREELVAALRVIEDAPVFASPARPGEHGERDGGPS